MSPVADPCVAVVVITRDRCADLLASLARLVPLIGTEVTEVVVVDNASSDHTVRAVRATYPQVRVLAQRVNHGAAGRTIGVRACTAPYVAFADDDSWWHPGSLTQAAAVLATHPRLGLLHSRIEVHPGGTDLTCRQMSRGVWELGSPGPSVLGHLACGVVVRREAYLGAGGYSRLLGFGGEEHLLAIDLARHGWSQCYVERVVSHHRPSPVREAPCLRRARCRRNDALTAVLRLPAGRAWREVTTFLRSAVRQSATRRQVVPLLVRLPAALWGRRVAPVPVVARIDAATATRTPAPAAVAT